MMRYLIIIRYSRYKTNLHPFSQLLPKGLIQLQIPRSRVAIQVIKETTAIIS